MRSTTTIGKTLTMVLVAGTMLIGTGCGKKKKLAEEKAPPVGETAIKEYCSGDEYFSDKKHFRANSLGESSDQATAKKKAMANARADLASSLQTTIQGVVDNYVNSREYNNREEVEERFEGLTREIIDQRLRGVKVICSQPVMVNTTGKYKYYVALELSGDDIVADYNERITKDEQLKIDYDYERFKETFEEEMQKMSER